MELNTIKYFEDTIALLEQTNKVNPYVIADFKNILYTDNSSIKEIERLSYFIVSNLCDDQPLIELQNCNKSVSWYDYFRFQIYLFLKGNKTYCEEKTAITAMGAIIIDEIANEVFNVFGVDYKLLPLIVSLIICVISKMSVKAWCEHFYNETIKGNPVLEDEFKKLGDKNDIR